MLGVCLLIIIILYLLLRRNENKLLEKATVGKISKTDDEKRLLNDNMSDFDEVDEERMLPVSSPEFLQKHDYYAPKPPQAAILVVSVTYSSRIGRLFVEVIQLESIAKEIIKSEGRTSVSIHARLQPLPEKFRHKTTAKNIKKPIFNEKFAFDGFRRSDLKKCWFRFRVYSQRTMGRSKLLGQVNIGVMDFEVEGIWSTLKVDVAPSEGVHRLLNTKR